MVTVAVVIAAAMLVTWFIAGMIFNVGIVDITWGLGFVLLAWTALIVVAVNPLEDSESGEITEIARVSWVSWLLVALVTIWGLRLAIHLGRRNIGKPEDHRYAAMRKKRGSMFWIHSLWIVFGLQGLLMWIVSLPVQAGVESSTDGWDFRYWLLLISGIVLWVVGFFFEAVGDRQLRRFKSDPENKGKVLNRGLWRFTRHPNYFGDFLIWWGLFLIAWSAGHWWTFVGPLVMSILLIRVSGVRMLEKTIGKRRPEYELYRQTTNAFFPWRPKRLASLPDPSE